jgi:hypothetical protein
MSNAAIDLWPSVFGYQKTELPDAILKEQANRLSEKTNHLVEARVEAPAHTTYLTDKIRLGFYLVAPRLGNYSYRLFTIEYGIALEEQNISGYPVTLVNGVERICQDREEFLEALREVFASQATMQVISALMTGSSPSVTAE